MWLCSAKAYPLQALMEDSRQFFRATGRRVTFEYTLMAGVNDSTVQVSCIACLLSSNEVPAASMPCVCFAFASICMCGPVQQPYLLKGHCMGEPSDFSHNQSNCFISICRSLVNVFAEQKGSSYPASASCTRCNDAVWCPTNPSSFSPTVICGMLH